LSHLLVRVSLLADLVTVVAILVLEDNNGDAILVADHDDLPG
jgi:hypothetical protein